MACETEIDLVQAMKRREDSAWDLAIQIHGRHVYSLIWHLTNRDIDTAEELSQQTWVNAVEAFHRFDIKRGNLRKWLFGIARNLAFEHIRKWSHVRVLSVEVMDREIEDGVVSGEEILGQSEDRGIVRAELVTLPEHYRKVLRLRYADGLSFKAIAAKLGMSDTAVDSLCRRALQKLGERLRPYFNEL